MDWRQKKSSTVQPVEVNLPCRPCNPRLRERKSEGVGWQRKKEAELESLAAMQKVRKDKGTIETKTWSWVCDKLSFIPNTYCSYFTTHEHIVSDLQATFRFSSFVRRRHLVFTTWSLDFPPSPQHSHSNFNFTVAAMLSCHLHSEYSSLIDNTGSAV